MEVNSLLVIFKFFECFSFVIERFVSCSNILIRNRVFIFVIDSKQMKQYYTEQHCVSIFCTCVWSVRKPLVFDTQDPEISGFQLRMRIKYKPELQPKMKRRENKNDILLASHQSTYVPEKHVCIQTIHECRKSKRSVVL